METATANEVALNDKNAEKHTGLEGKPRSNTAKRGFSSRNNDALIGESESRGGGDRKQRRSYNDFGGGGFHYNPRTVIRGRGSRFGRNRAYDNWNTGSYSDSDGHAVDNVGYGGRGFYEEVGHNGGFYHPGNDYRRRGGFMPGPPRRRRFNPNLSRRRTDSDNVVTSRRRRLPKVRTTSETAAKNENGSHDDESGENHHSPPAAAGQETQQHQSSVVNKQHKTGGGRRGGYHERRPYRTLPVDRVPRHFSTILVSGIPKTMNENGLFNYMQCFGDVANIRLAEAGDKRSASAPGVKGGEGEKTATTTDEKDVEKSDKEKKSVVVESENNNNKEQVGDDNDEKKSGGEEAKKDQKEGFYSAYVSFYNKTALKNLSAKQPVKIFDNEIQITDYRPPRRSGRSSSKSKGDLKEKSSNGRGILDLGDKVLIKIFEAMDFHTRFNAQFVCRRWHKNMARVRAPAFDAPSNVTLRIKRGEKHDRETVSTKYEAEGRILTVSVNQYYRRADAFLSYVLNNIVHQFGGGIENVEASHVRLSLDILLAIGLDSVSSIVIDRCTVVGGTEFSVLHSFCSHLGDRLKVLNANFTPWPGKISGAKEKRRSTRASTNKQQQPPADTAASEKRAQ